MTIAGADISGRFTDNRPFMTYAPSDPSLVDTLYKKNVSITAKPPSDGNSWLMTLLVNGLRIDPGERMWRTMLGRIAPAAATP